MVRRGKVDFHTTKVHCLKKLVTLLKKLWLKHERIIIMTRNEQALFAEMQNLGYSYGLCVTALHTLSQSKLAVTKMLAYVYEEQPTEEEFIEELAKMAVCHNIKIFKKTYRQ